MNDPIAEIRWPSEHKDFQKRSTIVSCCLLKNVHLVIDTNYKIEEPHKWHETQFQICIECWGLRSMSGYSVHHGEIKASTNAKMYADACIVTAFELSLFISIPRNSGFSCLT